MERAHGNVRLVRRHPRPEPAAAQCDWYPDEDGETLTHADEAQGRVNKREEGRNPQTVAEPVPVQERVAPRLVSKSAVIGRVDTGLHERAQSLVDVVRLDQVVDEP